MKISFRHPNPSLQAAWNYTQVGLLVFPLSPMLGAVGLSLVSLGIWLQHYHTIIRRPLNWGLLLLGTLLIATASFAHDKIAAFLGLFNFLPFFLLFAAFSVLIQTTTQLRLLSWILAITSLPVVTIGFGQLYFGWATPTHWERVLGIFGWTVVPGGEPPGRMASIFMYANTLAGYLIIVFILVLGLWLESYKEFKTHYQRSPSPPHPFSLIFLTVVAIADFVALILTNSRNAWAIAIFACLAYAIYQGWRILVAGFVSLVAMVLSAAFAPEPIAQLFRKIVPIFLWARLNDQLYPDRPVALLRTTQWQFAWSLTQQRPWTGWGLRNFTPLYEAQMHIWLGHPHNLFLMLFAETGLPTALLFFSLLAWILYHSVRLFCHSKLLEAEDRLIFFSYLLVFAGWVLFNTADVSLFDLRLNALFWLLLSAITGVTFRYT